MDQGRSGPDAPATAADPGLRAAQPAVPPERPAMGEGHVVDTPAAEPRDRDRGGMDRRPITQRLPDRAPEPDRGEARTDAEPAGASDQDRPAPPAPMAGCTAPQLRRFIKSRPYVPMHELRRRFGINGTEDDVSSIDLGGEHRVYVGLPPREGSLLGELLRGGDIGYELSLDPRTPIVIGLYPMRPVARS
jgi:hypothetical protein